MLLPKKLKRWLNGSFICRRCGREYHLVSFGFGETICPECYDGEKRFLFYDDTYWLNRILVNYLRLKS